MHKVQVRNEHLGQGALWLLLAVALLLWISPPSKAATTLPANTTTSPRTDFPPVLKCQICKFLVNEALAVVEKNKTEEKLVGFFESACKILFQGDLLAECDHFIEQYGPDLVQLILQELDATLICTKIGICPNSTMTSHSSLRGARPVELQPNVL